MTNLQAALGLAQLERIDEFLAGRREIMEWYRAALGSRPGLRLNRDAAWAKNAYWMVCLEVDGMSESARERLMAALKAAGVDSRPYFYPVSDMPMYPGADTPVTHRVARSGINLPSYVGLSHENVRFICSQVERCLEELGLR